MLIKVRRHGKIKFADFFIILLPLWENIWYNVTSAEEKQVATKAGNIYGYDN